MALRLWAINRSKAATLVSKSRALSQRLTGNFSSTLTYMHIIFLDKPITFQASEKLRLKHEALAQKTQGFSLLGFQMQPSVVCGRFSKVAPQKGTPLPHCRASRGGGAVVHAPGQLIIYPIGPIQNGSRRGQAQLGPAGWVRILQHTCFNTFKALGLNSLYSSPERGGPDLGVGVYTKELKKIGFVGVRITRQPWGSMSSYGVALNICNKVSDFKHIHPCGIKGLQVTSLKQEQPLHTHTLSEVFYLWRVFFIEALK